MHHQGEGFLFCAFQWQAWEVTQDRPVLLASDNEARLEKYPGMGMDVRLVPVQVVKVALHYGHDHQSYLLSCSVDERDSVVQLAHCAHPSQGNTHLEVVTHTSLFTAFQVQNSFAGRSKGRPYCIKRCGVLKSKFGCWVIFSLLIVTRQQVLICFAPFHQLDVMFANK